MGFDCFARKKQTVVHTYKWWVGNVWLRVWAVMEGKGPAASWGQLGKRVWAPREDSRNVRGGGCCPQYLGGDTGSTETICSEPLTSHPETLRLGKRKELTMGHLWWEGKYEIPVSLLQCFPNLSTQLQGSQ